jgi:phosphatidylserine decarboxylase
MENKSVILIIAISCFLLFSCLVHAESDCPPVIKLKELYSSDNDFQQVMNSMFANLQNLPDGTPNPWQGKTISDLYDFLNEWFYFLPNSENGLDRIIEFTMLYYNNPLGMKFVLEEPGLSWTNYFVEERGKFMDSPASAKIVNDWLADRSLGNEDFVLPEQGFQSFNEFFIRDIKPGARPISAVKDNSVLVSPADGVINMINNDLQLDDQIPMKGKMTLNLTEMLDSSKYASKFVGGTALTVVLMPYNYHHYHAPISGIVVESNENVGERLFGFTDLNDFINHGNVGYNKDFSVLEHFRHGYFIIKTEDHGYIAMVPVGLQTVGSVVFEDRLKLVVSGQEQKIYKGEKLGHFAYGGSTVLLFFEKGRFSSLKVQQGQRIGKLQ